MSVLIDLLKSLFSSCSYPKIWSFITKRLWMQRKLSNITARTKRVPQVRLTGGWSAVQFSTVPTQSGPTKPVENRKCTNTTGASATAPDPFAFSTKKTGDMAEFRTPKDWKRQVLTEWPQSEDREGRQAWGHQSATGWSKRGEPPCCNWAPEHGTAVNVGFRL